MTTEQGNEPSRGQTIDRYLACLTLGSTNSAGKVHACLPELGDPKAKRYTSVCGRSNCRPIPLDGSVKLFVEVECERRCDRCQTMLSKPARWAHLTDRWELLNTGWTVYRVPGNGWEVRYLDCALDHFDSLTDAKFFAVERSVSAPSATDSARKPTNPPQQSTPPNEL